VASATYNAANHQLTFGNTTLTYDLNGNLTNDGTNTYTWDSRNRLTAISGGISASFQYDAQGRRTSKTVNAVQTGFLYDGVKPVQELNGTTVVANLLVGLGIDEYLIRTDTSGSSHFLSDALGSTVALSDGTGALPTTYTYAPFGAASPSGSVSANAFDYTGRENDGTGLHYFRARYHHPGLQRFISEDPIRFAGGVNLYAHVLNNPLRWTDPLGLNVVLRRARCCYGFDHVGILVTNEDVGPYPTVGFYPTTQHRPFDQGVVLNDSARVWDWEWVGDPLIIKTTPKQDQMIREFIKQRTTEPGRYNILSGRHCGGFVQEALRKGKIDPYPDVANPGSFFEALKALNDARVDFTQGVTRQE
jgi:RHS repeat-associated protein